MVFLLSLLAACAVMEPPPGGPEDRIPPYILEVRPRQDSARVARDTQIEISFSEKLDEDSFKNRISLYPPVEFDKVDVDGDKLKISFRELLPETTFSVFIKKGFMDHHQVASKRNEFFYFSTEDTIASGEISGFVLFKEKPDSNGVAKLYKMLPDTLVNVGRQPESRISFADKMGQFIFRALPADGDSFLIFAFSDSDGDGSYSAGKEFSAISQDTVVLNRLSSKVRGIRINIIDPNEPGSIRGQVSNETGLMERILVRLDPLLPGENPVFSGTDTLGLYNLEKIQPGQYLLTAFMDIKADSTCGDYISPEDSTILLQEPCEALPDTLIVEPGGEITLDPVTLKKAEGI